jgi:hypothetical protein
MQNRYIHSPASGELDGVRAIHDLRTHDAAFGPPRESTPGIVAADHEGGAGREEQYASGKDEDEPRKVVIEEKAEEGRRQAEPRSRPE